MYKLSILFFFILLSCSDKSTNPPMDEKLCEITDTTSHAITWRVDTVGVFPSVLFDVAAIDENNVWAVGQISLNENLEKVTYNAVKWNGSNYEYFKVYSGSGAPRLDVVLSFASDDLWMFGQDRFSFWNGNSFSHGLIPLGEAKGSTMAAWGSSSSDFYLVGDNGTISHYDGNSFTLMESNTEVDLFDIDGYVDEKTGEKHIWALGWENGTSVVLKYRNGQWNNIWDMDMLGNFRFPHALYIPDNKSLIMSVWSGLDQKGGLYCFDPDDLTKNKLLAEHNTFDLSLAATSLSDLFIAGTYNRIEHFNGISFMNYADLHGTDINYQIKISGNKVYAVGTIYQLGLFFHGER